MSTAPEPQVSVLTPWYPTAQRPFFGSFVQAMVEATAPTCASMTVYHTDEWVHYSQRSDKAIDNALREVSPYSTHAVPTVGGASYVHIPVPLRRGLTYADIADRHVTSLRRALADQPLPTPIVHAHVGIPCGWAAVKLAGSGTKVYVTEHASYLDKILAQDGSRRMYDELLQSCAGFFVVSDSVRALLGGTFPHHRDRIGVIANPIKFDATVPVTSNELRRWIYVGNLIPLKRVDLLLEAFAMCRAEEPRLSLTYVGDGPMREHLSRRADELGIGEAVTLTGAVAPDEALRLIREHDLLVHPSSHETFGVSVIEAISAGLPVLVSRCGGPEETLAGIETAAGELFDVVDDPQSIVEAYRKLRARFPHTLDLPKARAQLAARYGYAAVASMHHDAWSRDRSTVGDVIRKATVDV